MRDGVYRALSGAFREARIPWKNCYRDDCGDGVLVLVPAEVPKSRFVVSLPEALVTALTEHNRTHQVEERIRLRLALHAGEVIHDDHGVAGSSINLAFRLVESDSVKTALAGSSGVLALIASSWFFDEVVRHSPEADPDSYRRVRVAVKETATVGWVRLPDHPMTSPGARSPAGLAGPQPRQLPLAVPHFAGREAALRALTDLRTETAGTAGAVVIVAIDGTPGIGKTALAVYWAHQAADHYPDGQFYVNLRGFDPAGSMMTPDEAIHLLLTALDVPPERIPAGIEAKAALYRSLLTDRAALVVLDNAHDADQVRPLLPSSPNCLVIVTSRNHLTSLIAREGAHLLTLDLLTGPEATQLLARRLGNARVTADPAAVDEIVAASARLPLALAIVSARAAAHPDFPLAALAHELREAHRQLDAFDGGDPTTNVRSVFSWSYHQLPEDAGMVFRILGLYPGPDITVPAAASLVGHAPDRLHRTVAELARAHLVKEHIPGRFTFHDLLRAYAIELTFEHDPEPERHAAEHRILDHYLHTAHAAAQLLHSRTDLVTPVEAHPAVTPQTFADYNAAWTWFQAEHHVLLAAADLAANTGHTTHSWQLPWTLMEYLDRGGHWHDLRNVQQVALDVAYRSGDHIGQVYANRGLGHAHVRLRRYELADTHLTTALELLVAHGDLTGQAHTHIDFGWMHSQQGNAESALSHAHRALELARASGDRLAEARALTALGWYHALLGHHRQSTIHCQHALSLYQSLGDMRGVAYALHNLGYSNHCLGQHRTAIDHYQQSLTLKFALNDPYRQAMALDSLGDAHHSVRDSDAARIAWQHAMDILTRLGLTRVTDNGYPNMTDLRAKLQRE